MNDAIESPLLLKEVSCRVTNSVLKYLVFRGYNGDSILDGLPSPYTREYLSDPLNWVTYEIRETLCRRAAALTGDDAIMFKVGLSTPSLNPLGGMELLIRKFSGPRMVYRFVPKFSRLLDRIFKFKTTVTGANSAIIEMRSEEPGYKPSKDSCYYAQGILAAVPTLWGLPPADIHEKKCMYKPAPGAVKPGVQYEAESCEYEVRWQPLLSWRRRLLDNIIGRVHMFPGAADFKELEQSLRHIDQKNTELIARNKQLAAVREIAISVDKVSTIDEALALTVEQAREIEGIRMVLVQKMDEARENVITPYYSRFRADTKIMVDALKAIGFDTQKVLGNNPTSNILRFPLSKLKVAQEYNKNPRVMVLHSLADLLDGVWPGTLCDAIQKIAGVKKFVIVPLLVEGESWGHILYFLAHEVPIDILEMIGGHCALAIKNIINLKSLEVKNAELSVLNRIAGITSRSLDMDTLLHDAVKEISGIYRADAAAIYLSNNADKTLQLAAQYGMPESMLKVSAAISLDDVPMGRFFLSQDNIMTGALEDYADLYPQLKKFAPKSAPAQYATSVLRFGTERHGLITVVRAGVKPFDEDERSLLVSIASQLAVSLENSKLHADVLKRAHEAEIARKSLEESIEKQKSAEEQLRESEERYRTIFESANDLLILIDNKARILDINAKINDIAGYTREEVLGRDFRTLQKMITKKGMLVLAKNFLKLMSGMEVPFFDVEMIKKTGEIRTIQINAVAVREEGKIVGGLSVLRDITGMKQAEKNLKSQKDLIDRILATIPNAVMLLDKSLKVTIANQAFYSLFKMKKNQVERKHVNDVLFSADLQQAVAGAVGGKEKTSSIEVRYAISSSEKILLMNIFTMKEGNLLLVINDVTEEREKQERLYLTDRLASVGEMASGVAHELNNPLTSIIGLSGLLVSQDIPSVAKEDLNAINSEAQRCAAIVRNLLAFARKHALKKEPVNMKNIVVDVLKLRAYEHKANNIIVETSFPAEFPRVLADYFQMQQVFLNIILNAEAAMIDTHGRGTLKVTGEANNHYVCVSFTDDGPGIPRGNLGLIFNPFFTTKEVGKGTGLGLSICYGIVTSHGGNVYAKSDYGKGATFVVELPVIGPGKE